MVGGVVAVWHAGSPAAFYPSAYVASGSPIQPLSVRRGS